MIGHDYFSLNLSKNKRSKSQQNKVGAQETEFCRCVIGLDKKKKIELRVNKLLCNSRAF